MRLVIGLSFLLSFASYASQCDEAAEQARAIQSRQATKQAQASTLWLQNRYAGTITKLTELTTEIDQATEDLAGCLDYNSLRRQLLSSSSYLNVCWIPFYQNLQSYYQTVKQSRDVQAHARAVDTAIAGLNNIANETNCLATNRGDSFGPIVKMNQQKLGLLNDSGDSCIALMAEFDQKNALLSYAHQTRNTQMAKSLIRQLLRTTGQISAASFCHGTLRQVSARAQQVLRQQQTQLGR